jgi:hypothetical protein
MLRCSNLRSFPMLRLIQLYFHYRDLQEQRTRETQMAAIQQPAPVAAEIEEIVAEQATKFALAA